MRGRGGRLSAGQGDKREQGGGREEGDQGSEEMKGRKENCSIVLIRIYCIINGQNREHLPSLSGLDREDREQDGKRTGYGYTRGSRKFEGRRRPTNLHGSGQTGRDRKLIEDGGRSPRTQTVRPRMR